MYLLGNSEMKMHDCLKETQNPAEEAGKSTSNYGHVIPVMASVVQTVKNLPALQETWV